MYPLKTFIIPPVHLPQRAVRILLIHVFAVYQSCWTSGTQCISTYKIETLIERALKMATRDTMGRRITGSHCNSTFRGWLSYIAPSRSANCYYLGPQDTNVSVNLSSWGGEGGGLHLIARALPPPPPDTRRRRINRTDVYASYLECLPLLCQFSGGLIVPGSGFEYRVRRM